ncbi:hypothetical protein D3C77_450910 [compost metagenome]
MLLDPGTLGGIEVQCAAIEQDPGTATGPAAQDVQALAVADTAQGEVNQAQQGGVITEHGKGEPTTDVLDEVIDLHAAQVVAGNQVVTADRIAEERVGLPQGNG